MIKNRLSELNLVWATDENYLFITGVSMVSAFENNRLFEKIRVWVLTDNVSEEGKDRLRVCAGQYNREIYFVDTESYLSMIEKTGARNWGAAGSFAAYSRLFIADIMEEFEVKKVIYCDCDLIIDGSLEEIWTWDLNNKPMGMVKEYNRVEIRDLLGLPHDASYYQSGLLVMDIETWKSKKCTERVLEHMRNVRASYPFVDQDLINCVLHDEICTLPIQYNVNPRAMQYSWRELMDIYGLNEKSYYTEEEFQAGLRNGKCPVVYHCSDPCGGRPWQEGNHHVFSEKWDYYYEHSIWHDLYKKIPYHPYKVDVIQYWLYVHLPKKLYVKILKYSARKSMRRLVKEYGNRK